MRRAVLAAAGVLVTLAAAGCGGSSVGDYQPNGRGTSEWTNVGTCDSSFCARTVIVDDHRCVVFEGGDNVAISCEWPSPTPTPSAVP